MEAANSGIMTPQQQAQLNEALLAFNEGFPDLADAMKGHPALPAIASNLLAGLIRDDERTVMSGIPGLVDLPIVGRLFAHSKKETNQTDVVLTLTPHIIRVLDLSEEDLRPFKVGDMITAGGVTGDVEEVGLFVTTLKTVDNLRVYVGNGKILADNVVNYTHNPYRRVDLKCQLAHTVDTREAMAKLKARLPQIPNVIASPAPDVEILEFNAAGTLLGVRPYCHNNHYWQVFFDTNKAIQEVGASNVWPVPAPHQVMLQKPA